MTRLLHALNLCGCSEGNTWHVDGRCVPLVTTRYLREQEALRVLRAEQEERRRSRKAITLAAARGLISEAPRS